MESSNPVTAAFIRFLAQEMRGLAVPISAVGAHSSTRPAAAGFETMRATFLSVAAFLVRMSGAVTVPACTFWTEVDTFLASAYGAFPCTAERNRRFFESVLRVENPSRLASSGLTDLRILPALQELDRLKQTSHAERTHRLLWEFAYNLFACGGVVNPTQEMALEEFEQTLAGRTGWSLLAVRPDRLAFFHEIQQTVNETKFAVEQAMKEAWKNTASPQSGDTVLIRSLHTIVVHLAWSIGDVTDDHVRFFRDFAWFFNLRDNFGIRSGEDRLPWWRNWLEKMSQDPNSVSRVPTFLNMLYLAEHDPVGGIPSMEQCRAMLMCFATVFANADDIPSEAKEVALAELRKIIYEPVPVPAVPPAPMPKPVPLAMPAKVAEVGSRSADELLAQLNSMVGLGRVKTEVRQLVSFLKVQQLRAAKGLPGAEVSRHLVFTGNPGTGKTTVARLLAAIYQSLGILSQGHLVETDRAGLVGGYMGQTALKVRELVHSALGGVLFIDEAYTLVERQDDSFGREAVDTLLKMMEDHRENLIVVAAGYTDRMSNFLSANPGMKSRFNKYIAFDDYTPDELVMIFEVFCSKSGFRLVPEASEKLRLIVCALYNQRDESFGNGRLARNLFETTINHHASRIVELAEINEDVLTAVHAEDIPWPDGLEQP